jgi:DNA-binding LacI/PurR family transcriptional regulator
MVPAVTHLVGLGHQRIGFISGGAEVDRVREDSWRRALAGAGLPAGPVSHVVWDAGAAAEVLLREGPTAVVCSSDALAIEVLGAARRMGRQVPSDVSIVGFDDSPAAALAWPALTSVRVDYAEFGEAAARLLLAAIAGSELPDYSPSVPELVVRDSTALRRRL